MKKITAKYNIVLDSFILVKRQNFNELNYRFSINGYDILMQLLPATDSGYSQKSGERSKSFKVRRINIYVSCLHKDNIPPIINLKNGRDLSLRTKYFGKLEEKYRIVVKESFNRFISFFKYVLNQPFLTLFNENHLAFNNPTWLDENGKQIEAGIIHLSSSLHMPEKFVKTGIIEFTSKHDKAFINKLLNPVKPKLYQELLSDARAAFFSNNYRRAIIEMAIACEIAVKHKFFIESAKTGSIYNYLEDKNKINIRVLELIDDAAKYVYGKSFKEKNKKDFILIDYLFRSRNKVAHRGKVSFRDEKGNTITPGKTELYNWWKSIYILIEWLEKI
jgi:hypothetical protein